MRSRLVVVVGIHGHDPAKECLPEDDHVVEALASCRSDQRLCKCVLPRRAWGDWPIPNPQPAQTPLHNLTIDGVTVSHEIFWHFIPRERLDNLAQCGDVPSPHG